jgi:uncharacterized membrane protein
MSPARLLLVVRTALCAALFACAALVIDYRNAGDPAFCSTESDCFKVRMSDEGREIAEQIHAVIPGASLPAVALAVFAGVLALTFFAQTRLAVRALAAVTTVGAVIALLLVYVQAKLGAYCAYCMVVDVSAVIASICAVLLALGARVPASVTQQLAPSMETRVTLPWGVAGALLTILPFVWAEFPATQPLPAPIQALQEPGKLTVVSFTDFQCPYCRRLHPTLKEIKEREDVVFVRYMVPLDGHTGAMPAALAYLCAPEDVREKVADGLYTCNDAELSYEGVVRVAMRAGVTDEETFRACMNDPATKARVQAEKKLFDDLDLSGLPTTFVGNRHIKGSNADRILAASRTAATGVTLPVQGLFLLAALVVAGAAWMSQRRLRTVEAELQRERERREDQEQDGGEAKDEGGEAAAPAKKKKRKKKRAGPST